MKKIIGLLAGLCMTFGMNADHDGSITAGIIEKAKRSDAEYLQARAIANGSNERIYYDESKGEIVHELPISTLDA